MSAQILTGLRVNFLPRPEGRSGFVYTAEISYPAFNNPNRLGTANSDVPAKTMRNVK